jgi:hypothetical protein
MRTSTTLGRLVGIATIATAGCLVPLGSAGAAPYPNGGNAPEVSPNNASTVVAGKQAARSTLPFTGTDIVELTAIAGVSAGVGLVMVRRSRRSTTA